MSHEPDRLTITCFGRAEFPADDPSLGTYWIGVSQNLGHGGGINDAIGLAERCVSRQEFDSFRSANPQRFAPERIIVRDSSERLVLGGRVVGATIAWYPPVRSDDEAVCLRKEADDLLNEAAFEAGWDNYSTARGLRARAALLEAQMVDPAWRTDALTALRSRTERTAAKDGEHNEDGE